jgi:hypothetical protein
VEGGRERGTENEIKRISIMLYNIQLTQYGTGCIDLRGITQLQVIMSCNIT